MLETKPGNAVIIIECDMNVSEISYLLGIVIRSFFTSAQYSMMKPQNKKVQKYLHTKCAPETHTDTRYTHTHGHTISQIGSDQYERESHFFNGELSIFLIVDHY